MILVMLGFFLLLNTLLHVISKYHTAEKPFPSGLLLGQYEQELPLPRLPEALPSISGKKRAGGGMWKKHQRRVQIPKKEAKVGREVGRGAG